jgi:hypothetical protein
LLTSNCERGGKTGHPQSPFHNEAAHGLVESGKATPIQPDRDKVCRKSRAF